jgi:negative regulator of replication initiation
MLTKTITIYEKVTTKDCITSVPIKKLVPLTAPKKFGMFTSAGNKSIHTKAVNLLKNLENSKSYLEKVQALSKFIKSFKKLYNTKNYKEAGDTAVREEVYCFAVDAAIAVGVSREVIKDLWETF